jgi:hypothetical protein
MRIQAKLVPVATLLLAAVTPVVCQTAAEPASAAQVAAPASAVATPAASPAPVTQAPVSGAASADTQPLATPVAVSLATTPAIQTLHNFRESDVKFSVSELMDILRDKRHEGWVLAAYPDPKTGRPLIGAGFSLDLPARAHTQHDPLNQNEFLEPSSAELWQAAGLDSAQLAKILDEFNTRLSAWSTRQFRRDIPALAPQITENDANQLLRIAIVQSAINAKAYCRNFDELTASQQMALSQLVYQMGVNLEEFTEFLALMNHEALPDASTASPEVREIALHAASASDAVYWKTVQQSLEQSQWARLYRARAIAVIAMLDPHYEADPVAAERRVTAVLRPAVYHRRRGHARASTELAANRSTHSRAGHSKSAHSRSKKTT